MDKRNLNEGQPDPQHTYLPLARWLREILAIPTQPAPAEHISLLETAGHPTADYHLPYYSQLPDFIMALLRDDAQATLRFAPLFFHLIGCAACHAAYLELYTAMGDALNVSEESPVMEAGTTPTLALTPPRMIVYMCQLLIKQADAVLLEARNRYAGDGDYENWARSLLRQALALSAHIQESSQRQRALQDLVRVAAIALGPDDTAQVEGPFSRSYTSLAGTGAGARQGSKTRRRAEMLEHPTNEARIDLQSGTLEGMIIQEGDVLHLILHGLDESLRGRYLLIAVPLGALLEPVRWIGKNPRAIRSQSPVDEQGTLRTPLGSTDLRLTNREDRNLLEAMFKKLDIRPVE
jgi:hypothetical protein